MHVIDCSAKVAKTLLALSFIELCLRILTGVRGFFALASPLPGLKGESQRSAANSDLFGVALSRVAMGDALNRQRRALKELSLVRDASSRRLLFRALLCRQQEFSASSSVSESFRGELKLCEGLKPESCESCEFCEIRQRSSERAELVKVFSKL